MNKLHCRNVKASGRLCGNQDLRLSRHFSGQHHLLLVASGETSRRRGVTGGLHIVFFNHFTGVLINLVVVDPAASAELLISMSFQNHVVGKAHIQRHSLLMAILGDMAHTLADSVPDGSPAHIPVKELHLSIRDLTKSGHRLDYLRLAVSIHSGNCNDFPFVYSQVNIVQKTFPILCRHGKAADLKRFPAGCVFLSRKVGGNRMPHHQLCQLLIALLSRRYGHNCLSVP